MTYMPCEGYISKYSTSHLSHLRSNKSKFVDDYPSVYCPNIGYVYPSCINTVLLRGTS